MDVTFKGGVEDAKAVIAAARKTPQDTWDDWASETFTERPGDWVAGGERLGLATMIGGALVLAGVSFAPFMAPMIMPLLLAVSGFATKIINKFIIGIFAADRFCDHPELASHHPNDAHWLHYPGRRGYTDEGGAISNERTYGAEPRGQGWGALGLEAVSPKIADYPWIQSLKTGLGPDLSIRVLRLPDAPRGSFLEFWFVVYQHIMEQSYLQPCGPMTGQDVDKQLTVTFLAFVALYNRTHYPDPGQQFPAVAGSGDDLTLVPHPDVWVHGGAVIPRAKGPRYIGGSLHHVLHTESPPRKKLETMFGIARTRRPLLPILAKVTEKIGLLGGRKSRDPLMAWLHRR